MLLCYYYQVKCQHINSNTMNTIKWEQRLVWMMREILYKLGEILILILKVGCKKILTKKKRRSNGYKKMNTYHNICITINSTASSIRVTWKRNSTLNRIWKKWSTTLKVKMFNWKERANRSLSRWSLKVKKWKFRKNKNQKINLPKGWKKLITSLLKNRIVMIIYGIRSQSDSKNQKKL